MGIWVLGDSDVMGQLLRVQVGHGFRASSDPERLSRKIVPGSRGGI